MIYIARILLGSLIATALMALADSIDGVNFPAWSYAIIPALHVTIVGAELWTLALRRRRNFERAMREADAWRFR